VLPVQSTTFDQNPIPTLLTCIVAHFVNDGLDIVLPLIMPILVIRYSLNLFEVGTILTCYSATTVVFQPLFGYATDITGYKKVYLSAGLIVMGVSLFQVQFASSLIWVLLLASLTGLGYSVYHPVAISFINAAYMERRGFGVGFHGLGGSVGRGVFPAALGGLLAAYGLGSASLFLLATALLVGSLVLRLPPTVGSRRGRKFGLSLAPVILVAAVVQLLRTVFYAGTVNFMPTYLVRELHLDIASAGICTSVMLVFGILTQPLGGHLSDKLGRRAVLGLSSLLMGLSFILFLWIPYPFSLVVLSMVGFWVFLGFPIPYAIVGDHVSKESIGTSLGIVSGLGSAGGIIAPLFVGRLGDQYGLGSAMLLASIFALAAAGICLLLPKGAKTGRAN